MLGKGRATPIDANSFSFNGRRYRGTFSVLPGSGEIVSTVGVDEYLYSVVSGEMQRSWPPAALQAQAIVARTYVLQRSNPNRDYDLVPSEADQVYTGMAAEQPATSAAVDATSGRVLRFRAEFAQLFYSSCCGGHTESSADAWGGTPIPYLSGVLCAYCTDSPWYNWTQTIPLDDVQRALGTRLASIGDLQSVELDPPDASGRAPFWTFAGSQNSVRIKAADLRRALGTRVLRSLLVHSVSCDGGTLTMTGSGFGHGVGLCQWGARGLAASGADAARILTYYFPGTRVAGI